MKIVIAPEQLVKLKTGISAVQQIEQQIAHAIAAGMLPPGACLPTIRTLAQYLDISSFTVMDAYQRLAARGFLLAKHKSAYRIRQQSRAPAVHEDVPTLGQKDFAWLLQETPRKQTGFTEISGSALPTSWEDHRIAQRALRTVASMGESVLHAPVEPLGYLPLREVLQTRLQSLGLRCHRDQMVITGGATAALGLLAALLVHTGDTVLVDDPGFFALHGLLHLRGAKVVGVPRLPTGPDLTALAVLVEQHRPKLFIVQSVLHSPTGSSIQADQALGLLTLAQEAHLKIIECDFYADLATSAHLRLATLATLDRVTYVGACAKTITGTARIGYIACEQGIATGLGKLKLLYGSANPPIHERVAYHALTDSHCARHISKVAARIQDCGHTAREALKQAGLICHDSQAQGKYLWVRHPTIGDSAELAEQLDEQRISLAPGRIFRPNSLPTPWFRVNVAAPVHLLAAALK